MQRFRTAAEAAANLDQPHIVPIHEVGESLVRALSGGQSAFTMQ